MPGYGEDVWFDAHDHTELHRQLTDDPAAARAAISRRPALLRSTQRCDTCAQLLAADPAPAAAPGPAPLLHARFTLEDLQELLLPALELAAGHRLVALYTEQASTLTLIVQCPDGEPPHP